MNIYEALYSRVGGRMWTYILRDSYHKAEFVWIMCLMAVGVVCGHFLNFVIILVGLGIFTMGFIFGHLFWSKDYIPYQGTDKEGKWDG